MNTLLTPKRRPIAACDSLPLRSASVSLGLGDWPPHPALYAGDGRLFDSETRRYLSLGSRGVPDLFRNLSSDVRMGNLMEGALCRP